MLKKYDTVIEEIKNTKFDSEILRNGFHYLSDNGLFPKTIKLVCIDGRRSADKDILDLKSEENNIAIPGGGLGLLMDAHTAVEKVLEGKIDRNIEDQLLISLQKFLNGGELGKITAHTDDHKKEIFFAGCGHCLGIHNDMKGEGWEYNTSQSLINFVKELEQKHAEIFETDEYLGQHDEQAVVAVSKPEISLKSKIGEGGETQVFVYDQAWHDMIIKKLSEKLAKEIQELSGKEINLKNEFAKLVAIEKGSRAYATVERLAFDEVKGRGLRERVCVL